MCSVLVAIVTLSASVEIDLPQARKIGVFPTLPPTPPWVLILGIKRGLGLLLWEHFHASRRFASILWQLPTSRSGTEVPSEKQTEKRFDTEV